MAKTTANFTLLPPKPNTCPECAVDHPPDLPHDLGSLYYQYKFLQQHGRWPTWKDAMAHCDEGIKEYWAEALAERGIEVE